MLDELDVGHIPMISVWNKVDVCANPEMVQSVADKRENTVCISAQTGQGLPQLMELVERKVQQSMLPVDVLVPYQQVSDEAEKRSAQVNERHNRESRSMPLVDVLSPHQQVRYHKSSVLDLAIIGHAAYALLAW